MIIDLETFWPANDDDAFLILREILADNDLTIERVDFKQTERGEAIASIKWKGYCTVMGTDKESLDMAFAAALERSLKEADTIEQLPSLAVI